MIKTPWIRNVYKMTFYILVVLGVNFSGFGQCPTVTNSNPPPICNGAGYTFANLSTDYATGAFWYTTATGGTFITPGKLVSQGTYFAGNNSGTCGSRQPITVKFQVDPVPSVGASLDKFYCSNNSATIQDYIDDALAVYIPTGGSVNVYYNAALTNQANSTDPITNGIVNLYIVFSNGTTPTPCTSQIKLGKSIQSVSPPDPTPNLSQKFCSDSNPTVGILDAGTTATYNWYDKIDAFGNPDSAILQASKPLVNGTYYVQAYDDFCVSNVVAVLVNVDDPVDAGTPSPADFCEADLTLNQSLDLFLQLSGQDPGGTWTDDNARGALTGSDVNLTLLPIGTSLFTYTVISGNECLDATSSVNITIYETLSSGAAVTTFPKFCKKDLPTSFDLFTLLNGTQDANGQWTEGTTSSGTVILNPMTLDLTSNAPGVIYFTYTQNIFPNPCAEQSTTVQVTVLEDPNAGTALSPSPIFCENEVAANSPFDLFSALSGQDNNLGTWTDATNTAVPDPLNLNISGFTFAGSPYQFTYTISNGTCEDTETISITIKEAPNAGTTTNPNAFCISDITTGQTLNLLDYLSTDADPGIWSDDTPSNKLVGSIVTLDGLGAGTYSFTFDVTAIGTCDAPEMPSVQITINELPNTGTANNPPPFCKNDAALNNTTFNLFTLLTGTVDSGGQWYLGTDTTGTMVSNILDLNTLTNIQVYNYTYSVTDVNGCENSTTISITIKEAPNAGTTTNPNAFCISDITTGQTLNLLDYLSTDADPGIWSDDTPSNKLVGSIVTLDGLGAGTYSFTFDVTAIGTCDVLEMPMVTITINDTPVPIASATQEFCDSATVANLTATGTSIQWYDDAVGGIALIGSKALVDGQTYYATQTDATTGCESSTRTPVFVTIYQSPNAGGLNTTSIKSCNSGSVDLTSGLDGTQDSGGSWYIGSDNSGVLIANPTFYDVSSLQKGIYQYTYFLTASAPCTDASTTITVTIEEPLNAGTDGTPLDLCSNNGTIDLFAQLGGSPDTGGTWTPAMNSASGVFDPLKDASGTYTYTLTNACGIFTSEIEVKVTQAPNAGMDNAASICVIDGITDLSTFLSADAQSGGSWTYASASVTGQFDPNVDPTGVYTYTVVAVGPCSADSTADITVSVIDSSPPIAIELNPSYCKADNPTVADLNSRITASGIITWFDDAALTMPLSSTEALIDGEDYYATNTEVSGCASSINVKIDVIVNDTPTPTLKDPNEEYCINDDPAIETLSINIVEYVPADNNILWYDVAIGGNSISNSTVLINAKTYYAVLVDAITGCESSVRLELTPNLTACGVIVLPDGFSPNGDRINDTYDYDNLDIIYPNFKMEIYNRYGNIVYKGNASTPRFDGKSNQARTIGSGDLPVGVYFYIFNFNDGSTKPKQGRLYLSR